MSTPHAVFLFVTTFAAAQIGGTYLHELGHLVGAWAIGWKPYSFSVGRGAARVRMRFGGLLVTLGLIPLGGLVRASPTERTYFRTKMFLFIAAGPLANLLAIVSLWGLWELPIDAVGSTPHEYIIPLALFNQAAMLMGSIWPHLVRAEGQRHRSDGLQMWNALRLKGEQIAPTFITWVCAAIQWHVRHGRCDDAKLFLAIAQIAPSDWAYFQGAKIHGLMVNRRDAEAKAEWDDVEMLARSFGPPNTEMLDALACVPLVHGQAAQIPRAIAVIEEAIALAPDQITLKGTKGSLLIESGQIEAGVALLEEVCQQSASENDRAICSYYLALAQSRLGHAGEARRRLNEAKRQYPHCIVAPRLERMILDPVVTFS